MLADWATNSYTRAKNDRGRQEMQWYTNIAFYMGKQNIELIASTTASSGYALNTPKTVPWRVRLVTNKIRPIIRTEISKVMSSKPIIDVLPGTMEEEDLLSAQVAKQIFWDVYRRKKVKQIMQRAQWWNSVCGNGFIKDYWDPTAVDSYGNEGDLCIENVTPFHIFVPDLREQEIEGQPWVIHAMTKDPEWVKRRYGKEVAANAKSATDLLDDSFLNLVGTNSIPANSVLCLEVWVKPGTHKDFPDGGMFTVIGSDVVYESEDGNPYDHGQYPFTKLDHIDTGKFYTDSVIVDLIPLQREYNRTNSQIVEAKNLMAKPKLMAPEGSVNVSKITSEPGQVVTYKFGLGKPEPFPMPDMPSYVFENLQRIQNDMDDISGQHEVPSTITAASAISFLQEQDDSKLAHTIDSIEAGIEKLGKHILHHFRQFCDEGRLVRIVGVDGSFSAQKFKSSDLKETNELIVEAGSAMPYSKAARQAFITDQMKMGFIDPNKGLAMLEIGGLERIFEEQQVDTRQAQRENIRMEDGENLAPNSWDNHDLHITLHDNFRKTQSYDSLKDEIKMIFEQHVQLHRDTVQQKQMEELQMQQMGQEPPVGNEEVQDPASMQGTEQDPLAAMQDLPLGEV